MKKAGKRTFYSHARPCLSWLPVLVVGLALLTPARAAGQSRCADCHFANPTAPGPRHLDEWDHSAHGRNSVGCETCHGGNPTTVESFLAHQNILHWSNPSSPVHRTNLPATCGKCHTGPFVAFQKSEHFTLLRSGDRDVPTCTTCHGEVAAHLLAPKSLESQCASCHGTGRTSPRPEYARQARLMMEGVRDTRESLKLAQALIRQIGDRARRERFEADAQQVQVPLTEAVQSGHMFVFEYLEERLATARERLAQLLTRLANPGP